ncbi:MAG TPA: hypothetical protein VF756_21230 [Thermoanaerobaculia bacterium]
MRSKTCRGLIAAASLTLLALPAWAEVQPQGRELNVNRRTDYRQQNPAAAFSPAGGSLVVWENDQKGIRGLFYGADGRPSGAELTLVENQSFPSLPFSGPIVSRREPALAFLPSGQFLLIWNEERADLHSQAFIESRQILDQDIYVQRFSAAGAPLGEKVRVNASTAGFQHGPKLLARAGRNFLVVWEDGATGGIAGRALNAAGQPVGAEIRISDAAGQRPALAGNAQGRVLVVWEGTDENESGISARLLDASTAPLGPVFRVNTATSRRQARPAVVADAAGNFFVAWQTELTNVARRGFFNLAGQAVGAGGNLLGPQLALYQGNVGLTFSQLAPALALTPSGHILMTWLTFRNDTTAGLEMAGLELNALGAPAGDAFWVTERRMQRNFRSSSIASNGAGSFLVSWETVKAGRQGIAGRRLTAD